MQSVWTMCFGAVTGLALGGMVGSAGPALAGDSIKIGAVLSVTGGASFLGDPEKRTLELYIDRLNAKGGVLGRKLELTVYDDGGAADKAASFAKRLISSDEVDIIIGGSTTATTMAVVPLVEKAETPFISMAGAVVIIDPVKKWVFKTPHTDRLAAEKVFADMKRRGITKIGLISENAGFGKSGHDQTVLVAPQFGIEIVADETYAPKDADTTAQLTKIRNTPGVGAVFNFGFGQGPAVVTRNFAQLGLTLPFYQSHGVASKEFIKLVGDAGEGIRLPASSLAIVEHLKDGDPQKPVVQAFVKAYEEAFKAEASTFAGYAYDALFLAVDAMTRAGSTDKAKVRDALEQTRAFAGTTGVFTMSATDHMGLSDSSFHMVKISKGDWELVD